MGVPLVVWFAISSLSLLRLLLSLSLLLLSLLLLSLS